MCQVWCSSIQGISVQLGGSIGYEYIWIVLYIYICQVLCSGIHGISAHVRGSICHTSMLHHYTPELCPRYLCIMLYVKPMWCSGLPWIYSCLEEGVGSVCHESDSMSGLPWIYGQLEGVVLPADLPSLCSGIHSISAQVGCQSVIDPCYTVTPPLPIDHRSMLHHYTFPLPIDHRSMLHHYTP